MSAPHNNDDDDSGNLLRGFDNLILSLDSQIKEYEEEIAPKIENIKRHIKLERERALKDSTKTKIKDIEDTETTRLNIPSWKLRVLKNLNWISEEQAMKAITNFKTQMLGNLDVEPTAIQEKHFSIIQPTVRNYFEKLCGTLESCSDCLADYITETRRTQPDSLIIYDEAVSLAIEILEQLQNGVTIKEFDRLAGTLITITKRIKAKMMEKRDYMTDRLRWRGVGIDALNL